MLPNLLAIAVFSTGRKCVDAGVPYPRAVGSRKGFQTNTLPRIWEPCPRQREVKQMRPTDRIAILGLMLSALGAAVFMTGTASMPLLATWLIGPLLWFFGFAMMVAWAALRMLRGEGFVAQEKEAPEAKPARVPAFISNFLEHDYADVA
jgi:hypothetical protein